MNFSKVKHAFVIYSARFAVGGYTQVELVKNMADFSRHQRWEVCEVRYA